MIKNDGAKNHRTLQHTERATLAVKVMEKLGFREERCMGG
jgi:hypothetical protein